MAKFKGPVFPRGGRKVGATVLPSEDEINKGEVNGPVTIKAYKGNAIGDAIYLADKYLGWIKPFNKPFDAKTYEKPTEMTPPPNPPGKYSGAGYTENSVQRINLADPFRAYQTFLKDMDKLNRRGYDIGFTDASNIPDGIGYQSGRKVRIAKGLNHEEKVVVGGGHEALAAILENEYRMSHKDFDKVSRKYEGPVAMAYERGDENVAQTWAQMIAEAEGLTRRSFATALFN